LTQPSGLIANITGKGVTISSGISANNKVYDSTTSATINSNNVVLSGVLGGDIATLSTNGYTASFASAGVANGIAVTIGGLSLTGANATNYLLTPPGITANITGALLTVTADNQVRFFGQPNPTLTASYSGFVNGEGTNVLSGSPALSTTATPSSPPGAYTITATQGTLTSLNYIFNFVNGTLTVNAEPAPVILSIVPVDNTIVLTWSTTSGLTYRVQYIDDLTGTNWVNISPDVLASGSTAAQTNAMGLSPQRFYRVMIPSP